MEMSLLVCSLLSTHYRVFDDLLISNYISHLFYTVQLSSLFLKYNLYSQMKKCVFGPSTDNPFRTPVIDYPYLQIVFEN